jgi:hypothetical protein
MTMPPTSLLSKAFQMVGGVVLVGGCSALTGMPVSAPIWLLIGIIFLVRPKFHEVWRGCTAIHLVGFIFIALLGMFSWIDNYQRNMPTELRTMFELSASIFWAGIGLAIPTAILWWLSASADLSPTHKRLLVTFQIILACAAAAYTTSFLLSQFRH